VTTTARRPGLAHGAAVTTLLLSTVAVGVLAAVLVPWDWVPGGRLVPVPADALFSAPQVARAERYAALQRALGWTSYFLSLGVLLVLGLTHVGSRLLRRVAPRRWWLGVPVGAAAVLLVQRLVTLPFSIGAHGVDLRFDISRQGWGGWSVDLLKGLLVSWVATSLVLLVVVGFARRSPRWWFAWVAGTAVLLTVAGSFLYPVVVEPLFNKFTPMQPGPFKQSIFRLADREGVRIDDVLVADASRRTTTLNAYVSGFGRTRRVVVYDNLLRDLSPAEARVVIAHELGHAEHQDVLLGTGLGAVGSVAGVALLALVLDSGRLRRRAGIEGAGDPAAVATVLALAAVGAFLVSPLQNTVSRAIEARADRTSLEATHADATFVRMQRQLALTSLSDPTPPALSQFWWGTHPTVLQRAGLPRALREAAR
jgi:STE24 endopeptidase